MSGTLEQISLLYELSLTNSQHMQPEDTARKFVKKLISRKALNFGAVWLFDHMEEGEIICKCLYSLPEISEIRRVSPYQISDVFKEGVFCSETSSLFGMEGHFAYFKLNDIGFLELGSNSYPSRVGKKSLYSLKDVVTQLAVSLESGFAYQKLQQEIRQRKIAEQSHKNTEAKYARIIENVQLGLLEVDNRDVIQYANKSFQEITGYQLSEIVGKKASSLFLTDNSSRETLKSHHEKRKQGASTSYELEIKDKHGDKKWLIISGAPNFNAEGKKIGSIGIHIDITEQKKLTRDNAFKDTQIRKLFEMSLDALISIDESGVIFEWSPQAEKIFGYSHDEAVGRTLAETIIPETMRDAHTEGLAKYIDTGHGPVLNQRIEVSALRKSGEEFPIELTIFPLNLEDRKFFTAFVRDITELKTSRENMQNALARQKELNNLKSQFISMTSHELRTPLTTIRTNTELMNYQLDNLEILRRDKLQKNVSRIENNVDRLNQLISNILMIGKLDSKKVPFTPEPLDVITFLKRRVLPNFMNETRKVLIHENGEAYQLPVDHKLFAHIVENLIGNAYKYSPDANNPELHIHFQENQLVIHVKDYGIGIPKKDQEKLFDTFYRASNVGNIQGSGVGLTIVHEFVKIHDGSISVESKEGEGTTFTVILPREKKESMASVEA